jgi:hypothetical protein
MWEERKVFNLFSIRPQFSGCFDASDESNAEMPSPPSTHRFALRHAPWGFGKSELFENTASPPASIFGGGHV